MVSASISATGIFQLVVQKSRRESAHARPFGGNFELKILRMRGFSSRFLDNQLENPCNSNSTPGTNVFTHTDGQYRILKK